MMPRKVCRTILVVLFLILPFQVLQAQPKDLEDMAREKSHHVNPGFRNPWLPEEKVGHFLRFLEWKFSTNPYAEEKKNKPLFDVLRPDVKKVQAGGDSVTYLGHGTLWIRLGGQNILTDPVFGDIVHFIRRYAPFPLPPAELPPVQAVLISHSHYDHLDKDSIRQLGDAPLYLTPLGYKDWFADVLPRATVVELDWFDTYTHGGVTYRFLPTQHWSKRTPWDANRRLWGSWLVEAGGRKVYYAGDSGYFEGFAEYGRKYGPIDAALLPIAAYEPQWFMLTYHMSPDEALKAFRDLRARVFIPQQWGVFDLTDEPMDMPARDYRSAAKKAGLSEEQTPLVSHGETVYMR